MTIWRAFLDSADRHGERPFLRAPAGSTAAYADGAIEYSYAGARAAATRLAAGYRNAGIAAGERVAIAFDSRLDVYLHLLALNALGASVVPLNLGGTDDEVRYVVEHSDAVLVTGAAEHEDRLRAIATASATAVRFAASHEIDAGDAVDAGEFANPVGDRRSEAGLLYTSGTTGKPKGCMLSNEYFLVMGREYNALGGLCPTSADDRLLTPLPPNHMNALATSFMAMLMIGGCVVQLDRFHPRSWWQTVRDERATIIHYLGVMPAILLTLPPLDGGEGDDFSGQVRFGFGAGSDPRHQQVFEDRFGFPLIEAWAMTETGSGAMIIANEEPRHVGHRCIGRPIPSTEYRIVDAAAGDRPVAPGTDGELLVRAKGDDPRAGFFSGYYKDPGATEAGWAGGWWHSGDIVREDDEGSLYFVDRSKNVIRRSGENIAAIEVEAALLKDAAVANCAVAAVPDEIRGDEVFALIVAAEGFETGAELAKAIFGAAMHTLSYFKAPGYIAFVDDLPLTASQKVNRAAVKAAARERAAAGDCIDLRKRKRRPRS